MLVCRSRSLSQKRDRCQTAVGFSVMLALSLFAMFSLFLVRPWRQCSWSWMSPSPRWILKQYRRARKMRFQYNFFLDINAWLSVLVADLAPEFSFRNTRKRGPVSGVAQKCLPFLAALECMCRAKNNESLLGPCQCDILHVTMRHAIHLSGMRNTPLYAYHSSYIRDKPETSASSNT